MSVEINSERFYQRLERLQTDWMSKKSGIWGGSDAVVIPMGAASDENSYSKSSSMHISLFGYEFPESIILLTRGNFYFMATAKKCSIIEKDLVGKNAAFNVHLLTRSKDEGANKECFHTLINAARKNGGSKIGSVFKDKFEGNFISSWLAHVDNSTMDKVEISPCLGLYFSVKDSEELENCKKAAILSNKVLKHGFVTGEMEKILDSDDKKSHESIANDVEAMLQDPSKIGVKISTDVVDSSYNPIVQSGGVYDIKVNAVSNSSNLTPDIIICSLGARYRGYCASISRTYMVDVPTKVEKTYATLLAMYNVCIEAMTAGKELKDVMEAALSFLKSKDASLVKHLPKSLGFAIGLEFRDSSLLISAANANKLVPGMVMQLSVGLHNVPLTKEDKVGCTEAMKKLDVFSLLISDLIVVTADGLPDVLTKSSKEFSEVSYSITGDKDDNDDDAADDENGGEDDEGGKKVRRSGRAKEEKAAQLHASSGRDRKQKELMEKRLEEGRRRAEKGDNDEEEEEKELSGHDLTVYKSEAEFPADLALTRLKVDMSKESILVPINGHLVPLHITCIKSMTQPEPDMRINFYVPGNALPKECPKNTAYLIAKYGSTQTFIKELTFRSTDGRNLATVYQQYSELKRRIRQRDQKAEQEKDLVTQAKLVRIKDQRVPRLQEVTMRPTVSGKKSVGTIEAHQNGLRFTSSKAEVVDVMYSNIKHAVFQPCDKTTMVLVHFHLKDFILIGKKKQKDVQFYTEVVDSSVNLDNSRRSSYDPDELDDEQREREMKKRLNLAFREFCVKVEKVASHYDFQLMMDVPFKKSGFAGTWSKEMVMFQPTTNCLVNLTEFPPFVVTLSDIEHAHFERVTYGTKAFDVTFIFKDWALQPRTIAAIEMKYMDIIQDWLNLVEITYTKGPRSINWNDVMKVVREERETFYDDVDPDDIPKPAGWLFLSAEDASDEEDENEESSYGSEEQDSEEEESSSSEDEDSDFESEDDSDDEDELEEEGATWEELERSAKAEDMAKRARGEEENGNGDKDRRPQKQQKRR